MKYDVTIEYQLDDASMDIFRRDVSWEFPTLVQAEIAKAALKELYGCCEPYG
jgi:hypothetical protein